MHTGTFRGESYTLTYQPIRSYRSTLAYECGCVVRQTYVEDVIEPLCDYELHDPHHQSTLCQHHADLAAL